MPERLGDAGHGRGRAHRVAVTAAADHRGLGLEELRLRQRPGADLLAEPPDVGAAAERPAAERAGQHRPARDDDRRQVDRRRGHQQGRDRLVASAEQDDAVDRVRPESSSAAIAARFRQSIAVGRTWVSPERDDGQLERDAAGLPDAPCDVLARPRRGGRCTGSGPRPCSRSRCAAGRRTRRRAGRGASTRDGCTRCGPRPRTTRRCVVGSSRLLCSAASSRVRPRRCRAAIASARDLCARSSSAGHARPPSRTSSRRSPGPVSWSSRSTGSASAAPTSSATRARWRTWRAAASATRCASAMSGAAGWSRWVTAWTRPGSAGARPVTRCSPAAGVGAAVTAAPTSAKSSRNWGSILDGRARSPSGSRSRSRPSVPCPTASTTSPARWSSRAATRSEPPRRPVPRPVSGCWSSEPARSGSWRRRSAPTPGRRSTWSVGPSAPAISLAPWGAPTSGTPPGSRPFPGTRSSMRRTTRPPRRSRSTWSSPAGGWC